MTTFGLVHGAWHAAWCWERLSAELKMRGHDVVAMDLPSDEGWATFEDYADTVAHALADARGDVVLVGHSLAGMTIPLVPLRRPVGRLVYLCALVPIPGVSFADQLSMEPGMIDFGYLAGMGERDEQDAHAWVNDDLAREVLFGDCDDQTAEHAVRLLRPQSSRPYRETCTLTSFPDLPATQIVCTEDRMVGLDWSRHSARERLGSDFIELSGSHSPFLSQPDVLADALTDLA